MPLKHHLKKYIQSSLTFPLILSKESEIGYLLAGFTPPELKSLYSSGFYLPQNYLHKGDNVG